MNVNCAVEAENEFWPILIQLISIVTDKHEKVKSNLIDHLAHLYLLFLCLFFYVKSSILPGSEFPSSTLNVSGSSWRIEEFLSSC